MSNKKAVNGTEIRSAYYQTSDGLTGLNTAVADDTATQGDEELQKLLKALDDAADALYMHLDANYLWD